MCCFSMLQCMQCGCPVLHPASPAACVATLKTAFVQVNGPSVYKSYLAAAQRVGLSDAAAGYWELHIKEDERHGRQMVEDVAVPLIEQ